LKQNVDVPQLYQESNRGCQYREPTPRPPTQRLPTPQAPDQSCGCQYREPTPRPPTQRLPTPQAPDQSCGCQYREPTPRPPTQRLPTPQATSFGSVRRQQSYSPILVGDVEALKLVDLDKYGLGHYRKYIQ
jgi:hypothetical protein